MQQAGKRAGGQWDGKTNSRASERASERGSARASAHEGASPRSVQEFSLAWWSFVPFAVLATLAVVGILVRRDALGTGVQAVGRIAAGFVGIAFWFLVVIAIAYVVYRLAGRSKLAGSITFAGLPVLAIVVVSALVWTAVVRSPGAQALPTPSAGVVAPSEQAKRFNQAMREADHKGLMQALLEIERDGLEREKRGSDADRLRGKVQRTWAQRTRDMLQNYRAAQLPLGDESFHDLTLLKQDGDYARRVEQIERAREANAVYTTVARELDAWVANEFAKAGASGYNAKRDFEGAEASRKISALNRVRELDDEILGAMKQRLLLLQRNGPWWHHEAGSKTIGFEDLRTLEQYNTIQERIEYFVKEQDRAQEEALGGK
jgi:hypothetical protein